jgi:hypothetical protein
MEQHVKSCHDHFLSHPSQLPVNSEVCRRNNTKWPDMKMDGQTLIKFTKWPLNTISVTTHRPNGLQYTSLALATICQSYQHSEHPDVGQPGCGGCPTSLGFVTK